MFYLMLLCQLMIRRGLAKIVYLGKYWKQFKSEFEPIARELSLTLEDPFFKLNNSKISKGRFIGFASVIHHKNGSKIGLIYLISLPTHRFPSTFELAKALPEAQVLLTKKISALGIDKYISISNIFNSKFDGVSFSGLENHINLAQGDSPKLLASIVVLPKDVETGIMKFYQNLVPASFGAKTLADAYPKLVDVLSKL